MFTSGLDVHKDSVFCATFDGKTYGEVAQYGTLSIDIKSMGEGLKRLGVQEIALESTGIYWIPIWNILEVMGFKLLLVNPFLIKQMPGRKSDVKDAQWIARLLHRRMLRISLVPDEKIRELRTYTRSYRRLVEQRSSVELRIERTLEMCRNVLYFGQSYNINRVPTYNPQKVQAKIKYHQRELAKLAKM